jgi:hypothetical protein
MPELASITKYILTDHAKLEMARRQITEPEVAKVLFVPEQTDIVRTGRAVYQSRLEMGDPPKTYLLRVFVDIDREPPNVVTVYRTSKVDKYWRTES